MLGADAGIELPITDYPAPAPECKLTIDPSFTRHRLVRIDSKKISAEGKAIPELRAGDQLVLNLFDDLILKATVSKFPRAGPGGCYFILNEPVKGDGSFLVDWAGGGFVTGAVNLYATEGIFRYVFRRIYPHDMVVIEEVDVDLRQSMMPENVIF